MTKGLEFPHTGTFRGPRRFRTLTLENACHIARPSFWWSKTIRSSACALWTSCVAAGFEALEASDADEAIRILEARPDIHLVFTDVSMPGIDGRDKAGPLHPRSLASGEVDRGVRQDHRR